MAISILGGRHRFVGPVWRCPILSPRFRPAQRRRWGNASTCGAQLLRSWRRYRGGDLLWGTNRESFWPQLAIWKREESLLWWIWTQHRRKRRLLLSIMGDPRWSHIRVIRLTTPAEVDLLRETVESERSVGDPQSR